MMPLTSELNSEIETFFDATMKQIAVALKDGRVNMRGFEAAKFELDRLADVQNGARY